MGQHIQTISHPIYSTVNPPATAEEINLLESTLNVQLPIHFRDYLSTWNGQQEQVPFIGYNSFLSIPAIIETWSMLNELVEDAGQIFKYHSGMGYQEVIADSFEEFSIEILKRFQANQFSFTDGVISFEDHYLV
ncbi:SMI1/KNR4 family protein [Brevibacillus brevis]|uniref:SMI1/KNR4 family protein n=1 Tax=Brevibacillus brevis TaxID=1393 RepID=A0A2Z4MR72_BREBE|nr:SMI1/KNR4 family protein [Brevibacillus brevis]AWX59036.1 SMI1/KNR4 family protein [Brevibacillus brevis]